MSAAVSAAESLVANDRARGMLVRANGRLRAFGLSVFVSRQVADAYVTDPHPGIGKKLLLECSQGRADAILDRSGVARGNAGDGLDLVVLAQGDDVFDSSPAGSNWAMVLGLLINGFQATHRGFRVRRIINEVFGQFAIEVVSAGGAFPLLQRFEVKAESGSMVQSALFVLGRDEAIARRSMLLPMFTYTPPRMGFTSAEQQLLRVALEGATDEQLAARLGIRLSAVKARWTRILQRVSNVDPDSFGTFAESSRRGRQRRHLILEYVRQNVSELTGYFHES